MHQARVPEFPGTGRNHNDNCRLLTPTMLLYYAAWLKSSSTPLLLVSSRNTNDYTVGEEEEGANVEIAESKLILGRKDPSRAVDSFLCCMDWL